MTFGHASVVPEEDRASRHSPDRKIPEAGGGWSFILCDLKTLVETSKALGGWLKPQ